jgi:hypothetical protein
MLRIVAHRLQEQEFGGLSDAGDRRLRQLATIRGRPQRSRFKPTTHQTRNSPGAPVEKFKAFRVNREALLRFITQANTRRSQTDLCSTRFLPIREWVEAVDCRAVCRGPSNAPGKLEIEVE